MSHDHLREDALSAEIVERLHAQYPREPMATVRKAVEDARAHFARAKIKDFVPLLIEREARARLERPV